MAFVVTAITSVAALTAASSFIAIATAVAEVGMAMTVVGTITKSKELKEIGGFLGLAGGVGSLVAGGLSAIGAIGEAVPGSAAAAVSDTAFDSWAAGQGAAEASTALGEFGGATASFEGGATAGMSATEAGTGLLGTNTSPITGTTEVAKGATGSVAESPNAVNEAANNVDQFQNETNKFLRQDAALPQPAGTDSNSIKSWWDKQPENVKNNILNVGGKMVGGLFQGWSEEQKLALERERLNLAKEQADKQSANANAQPTIRFKPVANVGLLGSPRG